MLLWASPPGLMEGTFVFWADIGGLIVGYGVRRSKKKAIGGICRLLFCSLVSISLNSEFWYVNDKASCYLLRSLNLLAIAHTRMQIFMFIQQIKLRRLRQYRIRG